MALFACLLFLVGVSAADAQTLISFATPQQGYSAINGQFTVTLQLMTGARPSSLSVKSGYQDVTSLFNLNNCAQAPCTISATLTTANGIVAGQNFLTASVLGASGAAQSAHLRFSGSGLTDPTNGSAPGYLVSFVQSIDLYSSTITIGTPTPTVIQPCTDSSIRVAIFNRSTLIQKNQGSDCIADTGVASVLQGLDQSDIVVVLTAPTGTTGTADLTAIGGSSTKQMPGYSAVGYGKASPGKATEAWRQPNQVYQTGRSLAGLRGNLVNLGCQGLWGSDSNGNSVAPPTLTACTTNQSGTLYSFQASDTAGFAIVPGAEGAAGAPGLPTIYVGNSSSVPVGDSSKPTNQIRPINSNTGGDLFTNSTYTPTWTGGNAAGGFYLVTLNGIDLSLVSQTLYVTNCGTCTDHTYDNQQITALALALSTTTPSAILNSIAPPNLVYLLTTVGIPLNADSDPTSLLAAINTLGVTPYSLQSIIPDRLGNPGLPGFSLASYSQATPAIAATGRLYSTSANVAQNETGALRGVLAKAQNSYYQPVTVGPFNPDSLPVYATADDYLTHASYQALSSTETVAWPHTTTPGEKAAYAYLSLQLINYNLYTGGDPNSNNQCQSECNDIRFWYTGDQVANLYSKLTVDEVPYPGDSVAAAHGFAKADFVNVQQQLELEQVYVSEVTSYKSYTQQLNTSTEQNVALALTQTGTDVALQMQNDLKISDPGATPLQVAGDVFNTLSSLVSMVDPVAETFFSKLSDATSSKLGVASGGLWAVSAVLGDVADGESGDGTIPEDPYITQLSQLIGTESNAATAAATNFNADMENATGVFFNSAFSDWFRLQSVALMSVNQGYGGWYVQDTDQGTVLGVQLTAIKMGARAQLWQQVVPQYFVKAQYNAVATGWIVAGESAFPTLYDAQYEFSKFYAKTIDFPHKYIWLNDATDFSWKARTSPGSAVCQDMTYIFIKNDWNVYWPSSVGDTLMGPVTTGTGLGNLGLDQNWLFDSWNIPWYVDSTYPDDHPWPILVNTTTEQDGSNDAFDFACRSHREPWSGRFTTSISAVTVSPSSIVVGTPNVTVTGTTTVLNSSTIPPGNVSITLAGNTVSAPIDSTTGNFSYQFATQSIPGSPEPYVISISYPGAGEGMATISPAVNSSATLTVLSTNTSLQFTVDHNPSYYNQLVTLTAVVKSPSGNPTGTVKFTDNSQLLSTQTLDSSGQAHFSTTFASGTHLLEASYAGASQFDPSSSDLIYQAVSQLTTGLAGAGTTTSVQLGNQTVHLTGRLTGSSSNQVTNYPPDGETVIITIGGVTGTATINSSAVTPAVPGYFAIDFPIQTFTVGKYPVSIVYSGDNNFSAMLDVSTFLAVTQGTSTFGALTPSQTISPGNQTVILSGRIASLNNVVATGTVSVTVNDYQVPPVTLTDGSFAISYNPGALLPSTVPYVLKYSYSGDSNYYPITDSSTSLTVSQTVSAPVFSNLTPSQVIGYGEPSVVLSGMISAPPQNGPTLKFAASDGAGGTILNYGDTSTDDSGVVTQHAAFSIWIKTTVKTQQMILQNTFAYKGGTMLLYMQNDQVGVRWIGPSVLASDSWLSVNTSPISDGLWHNVTLVFGPQNSANLNYEARIYKDGVVTKNTAGAEEVFYEEGLAADSSANFGGAASDNSIPSFAGEIWNGKIWNTTLTAADVSAELYHVYSTNLPQALVLETSFDQSSNTAINIANGQGADPLNAEIVGDQLPAQAPAPGENVQIILGANTFSTTIGADGTFSDAVPTAGIDPTNYTIQYSYSGDSIFSRASDTSTTLTVRPATTSVSLATSGASADYGSPVSFTATVASKNVTPTGSVTFFDNGTAISPAILLGGSPVAFTISTLTAGSHSITAVYSGSVDFTTSASDPVIETINKLIPSFTNIGSSTISYGTPSITLTGMISAGSAIPTGSVLITISSTSSGPAIIPAQASATIQSTGTFSATLATAQLPIGTYAVAYNYNSNGNFGDAPNGNTQLIVGLDPSSTSLTSSASSVAFETAVSLNATVTNIDGAASGTVTFMDGGTALTPSVALSDGAASLQTSALAPGAHSITAVYSGSATVASSTSNTSIITIVPLTTLFYSGTSPAPVPYGSATVYLSGQIAGESNGTVVDYPTGQLLTITVGNISQTVTMQSYSTFETYFPIMNLAPGTYPITLQYAGNAQFSSMSDATLQLTINKSTPVFSNLIPKPVINSSGQSIDLSGVVSAQPQTGAILQFTQSNVSGVGGVVLPYDPTSVSTDSATYSMWIKTSTKTQQMLFQASYEHPYIYMQNDQLGVLWEGAGDGWLSTDTTSISDGRWHNVAITFSQGKITFYKDGIATNDNLSVTSSYHSDGLLNLGGSYAHIPSFLGEMWNVKLWSKALSSADIQNDIFAIYGSNLPTGVQLLASLDVNSKTVTNIVNGATAVTPNDPSTDPLIVADVLPVPAPDLAEPVLVTVNGRDTPLWLGTNGSFAGTVDVSSLTTGTYPITYTFGGDSNFLAGTDKTTSVTVQFAGTTTSLTSSANPAQFASDVTFTATVGPKEGVGTPSGTVTFMDGGTQLGSPVVLAGSQAQLKINSLAAGKHAITAIYSGDTGFASSTSDVLTQSIAGLKPVFVSLTPSQTIPLGMASVTLGGQISAGTYIPSGVVSITLNGSTTAATIRSDGTFSANVDSHALSIDSYAVTYSFAAGGNFKGVSDSNTRITVAAGSTLVALSSSTTTANYGTIIVFTATLTNPGTATGTVTFFDNGKQLGLPVTLAGGNAMLQTGSLAVGSHSITAVYTSNSPGYTDSTSAALIETISAQPSVFSNLTPSQTTSTSGSPIALSGTLSSPALSTGSVIQFATSENDSNGGVVFPYDVTGVSTDSASYSMWIKTTAKTQQMLFEVAYEHPYIYMQNDQLGILWDGSGAGWLSTDTTPVSDGHWHHIAVTFDKGNITFYKDGVATSDTFAVTTTGQATSPVNLGGSYNGIPSFAGQMWDAQIWAKALSATDIFANMNETLSGSLPSDLRLLASFNADAGNAVNAVNGNAGSNIVGSLAWATLPVHYQPMSGESVSVAIGSAKQSGKIGDNGSFTITVPITTLTAGTYPIQYGYRGNTYLASTADESTSLTVTTLSTNTALTSSSLSADYGTAVTFTAAVTSQNGVPTGTVTFEDGGNTIGAPVTLVAGSAQLPISTLSVGLHSITAVYNSDDTSKFSGSGSAAITQTITRLSPVFSNLTKSQSIAPGAALTVGGTIAAGSAIPNGGVVISLNNASAFAAAPQTVPIGSDGKFSLNIDTTTMAAGTYQVTYSYLGSDTFNGVTDSNTTTIAVVGLVTPVVTMQASPNPVQQGNTVTLTATVQKVGGVVPTGNVTFSETVGIDGLPLPGGVVVYGNADLIDGTATLTVTSTSNPTFISGTHVLVATYGGDGGKAYNGSSSSFYDLTVNPSLGSSAPGLTLTVANGGSLAATVAKGGSATFPLSLAPSSGFTGSVAITCTPADVVSTMSCSAVPALVTLSGGPQTAAVTITTVGSSTNAMRKIAFLIGGLGLIPLAFRRRRALGSFLVLVSLTTFASAGCGGGGSSQKLEYANTGTYNFTITASSTSGTPATSSIKVSVIVQ